MIWRKVSLKKIEFLYVSDFFLTQLIGGGELNDHELCLILDSLGHSVKKIQSNQLNLDTLLRNPDSFLIISNFVNMSIEVKKEIEKNRIYVIYEHDHKYLKSRNPSTFKDFLAPSSEIINRSFYKNAKAVFCQSSFHEKIIYKNLKIDNLINLSGNLWSEKSLRNMSVLCNKIKKDCYSILNSSNWHKNTSETSFYCKKKGYNFQLVSSPDYNKFLSLLSENDKFIFLPKTPETLSRVVVEARMMGLKIITNENVGASYEAWFDFKGLDLIEQMRIKRIDIPEKLLKVFHGE